MFLIRIMASKLFGSISLMLVVSLAIVRRKIKLLTVVVLHMMHLMNVNFLVVNLLVAILVVLNAAM